MAIQQASFFRLLIAMIIGLFVIEVMIELTTGTTLMGGRDGIFISRPNVDTTTLNTPMEARGRTIRDTNIHEFPFPQSSKVGKIMNDTNLRIIAKTSVGKVDWYQMLRFGGKVGYVPASDVEIR
jgi:hypothetical protein